MPALNEQLPLPAHGIKLVLFDMDQTLLAWHTHGLYQGSVEWLAGFVVWPFLSVVPRLLDRKVQVGVVTFSDHLAVTAKVRAGSWQRSSGLGTDSLRRRKRCFPSSVASILCARVGLTRCDRRTGRCQWLAKSSCASCCCTRSRASSGALRAAR